jgi:predicted nucleic acid binding AN1-type Zn finger protein
MANSENGDLMAIGAHCNHPGCGQNDFLPFKCDCCNRVFCLDHRTYSAHNCPRSEGKETQVIVCPICAKSIRLVGGRDVHEAFEEHCRTRCDPTNYSRVHGKKARCPVKGCKVILTDISSYICKKCGQKVCLGHRLDSDHSCPGANCTFRFVAQFVHQFAHRLHVRGCII